MNYLVAISSLLLVCLPKAHAKFSVETLYQSLELKTQTPSNRPHKRQRGVMSYLDGIELRLDTKSNDSFFDTDYKLQDEQSLRFTPKWFNENKKESELFELFHKSINSKLKLEKSILAYESYMLFLKIKRNIELIDYYKEYLELYNDKLSVIKSKSSDGLTRVENTLTAKKKIATLRIRINNTQDQLESDLRSLGEVSGQTKIKVKDLDFSSIVSLHNIKIFFQNNKNSLKNHTQHAELKLAKLELKRENKAFQHYQTSKKRVLDFVEITRQEDTHKGREEIKWALQVGINLDLFANYSIRDQKEILSKIEAKGKYRQKKDEVKAEHLENFNLLKNALVSYRILGESQVIQDSKKYLKIYNNLEGADPLEKLSAKERIIDADFELKEYKHLIWVNYIKSLYSSGLLYKNLQTNLLTKTP